MGFISSGPFLNSAGQGFQLFIQKDNQQGIYADAAARDVYFGANPDELLRLDQNQFLIIKLNDNGSGQVAYQQRSGGNWLDVTSLVQGATGPPGATGNSYFFSSIAARDTFFGTPPNEALLENGLPVTINIGDDTSSTYIWGGPTTPTSYDPTLWRLASVEVNAGTLILGTGGARISSGNKVLDFVNAEEEKSYVACVSYDDTGSEIPFYWELDAIATFNVGVIFDTPLTDPQTLAFTSTDNALVTTFTIIPDEAGTLRVQGWVGVDETGPSIFDAYFEVLVGDIGSQTSFILPNDVLFETATALYFKFSGVDVIGGTQPSGPFVGQTILFLSYEAQLATKRQSICAADGEVLTSDTLVVGDGNASVKNVDNTSLITSASSLSLDLKSPDPVTGFVANRIKNSSGDEVFSITYTESLNVIAIETDANALSWFVDDGLIRYINSVGANMIVAARTTNASGNSAFELEDNTGLTKLKLEYSNAGDSVLLDSDTTFDIDATNVTINADTTIDGKLTVTGLIDPTALVLTEQASVPTTPVAGFGYLWTKNTSPSTLIFTDDSGTDHLIEAGGGDVSGPVSSIANSVTVFSDTSGKVIDDIPSMTIIESSPDLTLFMKIPGTNGASLIEFRDPAGLPKMFFQYSDLSKKTLLSTSADNGLEFFLAGTDTEFQFIGANIGDNEDLISFTASGTNGGTTEFNFGIRNPEGLVPANQGTVYFRSGSTPDIYFKLTGTGNTGWVDLLHSATGVKGPTSSIVNSIAIFDVTDGSSIDDFDQITVTSASDDRFLNIDLVTADTGEVGLRLRDESGTNKGTITYEGNDDAVYFNITASAGFTNTLSQGQYRLELDSAVESGTNFILFAPNKPDTSTIYTMVTGGTNGSSVNFQVGNRNPEGNLNKAFGHFYFRGGSSATNIYAKKSTGVSTTGWYPYPTAPQTTTVNSFTRWSASDGTSLGNQSRFFYELDGATGFILAAAPQTSAGSVSFNLRDAADVSHVTLSYNDSTNAGTLNINSDIFLQATSTECSLRVQSPSPTGDAKIALESSTGSETFGIRYIQNSDVVTIATNKNTTFSNTIASGTFTFEHGVTGQTLFLTTGANTNAPVSFESSGANGSVAELYLSTVSPQGAITSATAGDLCIYSAEDDPRLYISGTGGATNNDWYFSPVVYDGPSKILSIDSGSGTGSSGIKLNNSAGAAKISMQYDQTLDDSFILSEAITFTVECVGQMFLESQTNYTQIRRGQPSTSGPIIEYSNQTANVRFFLLDTDPRGVTIGNPGDFGIVDDTTNSALHVHQGTTGGNDGWRKVLTERDNLNATTGWLEGGQVTINVDTTKLDISAGTAIIVDMTAPEDPSFEKVTWTAQTAFDPALSGRSTWIGVQSGPTFVSIVEPTPANLRNTAILARVWDTSGTGPTITNVGDYERPTWGLNTAFQDFITKLGSWNIEGNVFSANNSNLLLDKSAGASYRYHTEDTIGSENVHSDPSATGITAYNYHLQGVSSTTLEVDIDPDFFDNAGTKTAVTSGYWQIQEIWMFPVSGTVHILYGQIIYPSKVNALAAIDNEQKVRNDQILDGAVFRAYLVVQEGMTTLDDAIFRRAQSIVEPVGGEGGNQSFVTRSYAISDYGTNDSFFVAGFYEAAASSITLTIGGTVIATFGTANKAAGAHAFCVAAGAGGTDLVLTVSGTSITDDGIRTTSDSEIIVPDTDAAITDQYFETNKKWLGQVTYTLTGTSGSFVFNYGFAKYEDFGNRFFTVTDLEVVGLSNANASNLNIELFHHSSSGWTYAAAGFVPGGDTIVDMATDYGTDRDIIANEYFPYKRANLSYDVDGTASEGVIIKITQTTNNAIRYATAHIGVLL